MKKKCVVIIIILIVILIGVGVFSLIKGIKDDQKKTEEVIKKISTEYTSFSKKVEEFSKLRDSYYSAEDNDFYIEEMPNEADKWNEFIVNYEKAINDVEKGSSYLKKQCDIYIVDANASRNCTSFKQNYELAMNYYITDINLYNKFADEYNKWIDENNNKYTKLNKVKLTIHKDFIDYNEDKQYLGRSENGKDGK